MTALISTTRVESVGVSVGVKVAVAVGVKVEVSVAVAVGVSVAIGVRVGVFDDVSDGSTISVGSAAVECPTGLNSKNSTVPHVTRHSTARINKNRRMNASAVAHLRLSVSNAASQTCAGLQF
jgi:hypothetical protein